MSMGAALMVAVNVPGRMHFPSLMAQKNIITVALMLYSQITTRHKRSLCILLIHSAVNDLPVMPEMIGIK